ncbi:hypothetical protein SCHPADRAFT_853922, partial [Schizopora paradoxa]
MPTAKGARFDSYEVEKAGVHPCSIGTRECVLHPIRSWAISDDQSQERIFWIDGLAGIGKSTIAMTIAKWANENGILGGSFFFVRDAIQLSDPGLLFPSLAAQLARFDPEYKVALYDVLFDDPDTATANLQKQFDELIRKPLAACCIKRPILLVLDALDECAPADSMLRLLLQCDTLNQRGPELRILITSRPEAHIVHALTPKSLKSEGRAGLTKVYNIDN